jgi:hypothetical protein
VKINTTVQNYKFHTHDNIQPIHDRCVNPTAVAVLPFGRSGSGSGASDEDGAKGRAAKTTQQSFVHTEYM